MARSPLSAEQRQQLTKLLEDGEEGMICCFPWEPGVRFVCAYPMGTPDWSKGGSELAHPEGAVWLPEFGTDDDRCLSVDEARRLALTLLQAADWVEFGPGAFDSQTGEWQPEQM